MAFRDSEILWCQVRVGWCDPESAPKKRHNKHTTPFNLPPCMDPAHLRSGAEGGELFGYDSYQQQQMWYPQQIKPQMMIMASSGPMSHVSSGSGGRGASSSQDPLQYQYYDPYQHYEGAKLINCVISFHVICNTYLKWSSCNIFSIVMLTLHSNEIQYFKLSAALIFLFVFRCYLNGGLKSDFVRRSIIFWYFLELIFLLFY